MYTKILSLLFLTVFLFGCSDQGDGREESTSVEVIYQIPPSYQIALDAAEQKTNYYQELVKDLQAQLVAVKADMFATQAEYEARIEALQAALDALQPTPEESYSYTLYGGNATIVSYLGNQTDLVIPTTLEECPVTKIADHAFENNTAITSIVIPEGVSEIGWFAFGGCVALKEITLPVGVISIQYGAFENHHSDLVIVCSKDSYAYEYAQSYGIACRISE